MFWNIYLQSTVIGHTPIRSFLGSSMFFTLHRWKAVAIASRVARYRIAVLSTMSNLSCEIWLHFTLPGRKPLNTILPATLFTGLEMKLWNFLGYMLQLLQSSSLINSLQEQTWNRTDDFATFKSRAPPSSLLIYELNCLSRSTENRLPVDHTFCRSMKQSLKLQRAVPHGARLIGSYISN